MKHPIEIDRKEVNKIRFFLGKTLVLSITEDGFVFNHEDFPSGSPEVFADLFVHILEKQFEVKFLKKEDK